MKEKICAGLFIVYTKQVGVPTAGAHEDSKYHPWCALKAESLWEKCFQHRKASPHRVPHPRGRALPAAGRPPRGRHPPGGRPSAHFPSAPRRPPRAGGVPRRGGGDDRAPGAASRRPAGRGAAGLGVVS